MSLPRTLALLAISTVLLGLWLFAIPDVSQATSVALHDHTTGLGEPIALLQSDARRIVFTLQLPDLEFGQKLVNGIAYDVVSAPGFSAGASSGSPSVPSKRVLLGIPLSADYRLRVSVDGSETAIRRYRLLPAPTPVLEPPPDETLDPLALVPGTAGWDYVEDKHAYSTDALYPHAVAEVVTTGFIRDQRFIAVQVNPVQYNPVSGKLTLHDQVTVEIEFTYPRGPDLGVRRLDASFEPVLSGSLLNYESAANWRGKPSGTTLPASTPTNTRDAALPELKIMVDEDGIYQVTATDLVDLDVLVSEIPTSAYKLRFADREVPIRVFDAGDGSLESLWFYGEQAHTKYTDTNVYWLTYDPTPEPGMRMPTRSAAPTTTVDISPYYSPTVRLEEDHEYRSYMPWAEDLDPDPWDHWFWDFTRFYATDPDHPDNKRVLTFTTRLNGLSTAAPYSATLGAAFTGWSGQTYPDFGHCVDFYVNGELVGTHEWSGKYEEQVVAFPLDSAFLLDGLNAVKVQVCESDALLDITFFDWFELDIRRSYHAEGDTLTFDVTQAGWQYELDGFTTDSVEIFGISGTYTVSQLADFDVMQEGPPYSIAFYDGKAEQGTRYHALTRDQLKHPVAIVKDKPSGLKNWSTPPDYIIIAPEEFVADVQPLADHRAAQGLAVQVADLESVFDEFNYGVYSPEAIRAFLAYEYDHWYPDPPSFVLLVGDGTYDYKGNLADGNPNLLPPYLAWVDPWIGETAADNRYVAVAGGDPFPDMHIGRLPAETSTHVQAMVDKTIAYETNPAPRDWTERVLFVADDYPDSAGNFPGLSDDLVNNYLPEPYVATKAYYQDTCLTGAACTQMILDTLNTTGALLVNYIGHGGSAVWAGYPEIIWEIDDLASLVPTARMPVMLPMTCWEGAFHQATQDALAEETVRLPDRGAVASWSPSGEGVAVGHDYLNKGFLQAALYDGVRQLGAATDAGKLEVFNTHFYTDLLETYHLFGDPALRINSIDVVDVAVGQSIVESADGNRIEITLTFTNAGPDVAVGVALTDVIPAELIEPTVVFTSPEVLASREGITFAWTIADLLPGASGEIILEAYADPEQPYEEISFFNVAQISAETHDLVPGNNVSRAGLNLKYVYLPVIMRGS